MGEYVIEEFKEACAYYESRVKELGDNYSLRITLPLYDEDGIYWAAQATINELTTGKVYISVYVFEQYRGQGRMTEFVEHVRGIAPAVEFITAPDCGIEQWFIDHNVAYKLVDPNV